MTPPQIWFPGHSPRPFYADFAIPLGGAPGRFLSTLPQPSSFDLALMDDLDIVAVRIEHPCRIIAGIVFEPSLRCCLAIASGGHSGFVECIYLIMVFRYKYNMHRLGIEPSFFEPEKSSFAVTKTPQIGVSVMAFVICKVCDSKWLQGLGVKEATERSKSLTVRITWSIILCLLCFR